ncbi:bestrophin-like domain [Silvibacterium acidisoli]|uniref:bestrophin-like domain n=1 Tax=Acidobacteriaceae bacterium ZG23-2 TaxID=2883246 RepID=UPI00406D409C
MLTYLQTSGVALLSVVFALSLVLVLDRRMENTTRKRANGVNGWQLSILGAIYAVVLGFMLSDGWIAYQRAIEDVRAEASAVRMIDRVAGLMPASCAALLQQETQNYVTNVIDYEWPAMEAHSAKLLLKPKLSGMWVALGSCEVHDQSARTSVIQALADLQSRRDARVQDCEDHLPLITWAVLLLGGVSVVISSCLLSNERRWVHYFHVASLTMLISVSLLAISDLDRPFEGATHIEVTPFRIVQAEIQAQSHP